MGIRIALFGILFATAGVCASKAGEPSSRVLAEELGKLLSLVTEQNVTAAGAVKSIRLAGASDEKFAPGAFDGLEKEASEIDFVASGDRYSLQYKVESVPAEKTSTRVTCRFDGENWGRLEEDQYNILYTSKTNQRERMAVIGTNFFGHPFLPITMLGRRGNVFDEALPTDLADSEIWRKCLALATSAEVIDDQKFGKLAVVTIADTVDPENGRTFRVYFSHANSFYPVKWSMDSKSGNATEFSISELGEVKFEGGKSPFYYPKKAQMIRKEGGNEVSSMQFQITAIEINAGVADEQFSLPIENASSIIDVDTGVAISVPK